MTIFLIIVAAIFIFILLLGYPSRQITKRVKYSSVELSENSNILQNIIKRSSSIKISRLASMLKMDEDTLLRWLYTLPDTYGFKVADDILEFNQENLESNIDALLEDFARMEQQQIGKV